MAREKGTFNFSANLEVKKQGPLDARQTMITYAELTQAATWQDDSGKMYLFNGLTVPVTNGSSKELYMLIDANNYNQAASWKRVDAGGAQNQFYIIPQQFSLISSSSNPTELKEILGPANDLINAVKSGKILISLSQEWTGDWAGSEFIFKSSTSTEDNTTTVTLMGLYLGGNGGSGMVYGIVITITNGEYVSATPTSFSPIFDVIENKGLEIGDTDKGPGVGLKLDKTTPGNVTLSVGANGLKANFTETTKGVKSSDKVLKVEPDKTISSTIGLAYSSETKKLQLTGINQEVFAELDATPFIKDGMLNSATLEVNPSGQSAGTYLKLVFNTDSGKDPMYINVTSLIDVYTQGNGISISGKSISVKIDSSTEKYLSVSAAGLKLSGVNQAIADAITEAFKWHDA